MMGGLGQQELDQQLKNDQCNQQAKVKKMTCSYILVKQKGLNKMKHTFMMKTLCKLGIERFLNLIKSIFHIPIANIYLMVKD